MKVKVNCSLEKMYTLDNLKMDIKTDMVLCMVPMPSRGSGKMTAQKLQNKSYNNSQKMISSCSQMRNRRKIAKKRMRICQLRVSNEKIENINRD